MLKLFNFTTGLLVFGLLLRRPYLWGFARVPAVDAWQETLNDISNVTIIIILAVMVVWIVSRIIQKIRLRNSGYVGASALPMTSMEPTVKTGGKTSARVP